MWVCESQTPNLSLPDFDSCKFVFCVCESVSVLQTSSIVSFSYILHINDI